MGLDGMDDRSHPPMSRSVLQQLFGDREDVVDGEAELLEQLAGRGRLAVGGHADDAAVEADILVPVVRMRRLDGDGQAEDDRRRTRLRAGAKRRTTS